MFLSKFQNSVPGTILGGNIQQKVVGKLAHLESYLGLSN